MTMRSELGLSIVVVIVLAAIHPVSVLLSRRHVRRRTTSFCAGIALAYVFLHLLPELGRMQQDLLERRGAYPPYPWFREHVYVLAFAGLLLFQVMDVISRKGRSAAARRFSYKAEMAFFALYAALIGYLITGNVELDHPLFLITIALAAHFFGTDLDLAERYEEAFVRHGGYVLAAATLAGMLVALVMEFGETVLMAGFAVLAGALLINTLRTELPEPERVRSMFLLIGAVVYAFLILFIYSTVRGDGGGEAGGTPYRRPRAAAFSAASEGRQRLLRKTGGSNGSDWA
ncbi:MAG: hypothetical protein GF344_19720 [Chitinivibrionales bacterium]|nr:hypothetical protein [Chitinivibrionales bacterium]